MSYQMIGFSLFLIGYLHVFYRSHPFETRVVRSLQAAFNRKGFLYFFREIWFFGRTSFTLIALVMLAILKPKAGLIAAGVFLGIVIIEQLIKRAFNRTRPYLAASEIDMLQPLEPHDPSFPSGDALRVWFLAALLPFFAGDPLLFKLAVFSLALLVTLGRMVMGVHYLSDTAAGAGLGLLGAGTAIRILTLLN